jgi:hypothetical protein
MGNFMRFSPKLATVIWGSTIRPASMLDAVSACAILLKMSVGRMTIE